MPVITEAKSPQVAALVDLAHHAMRSGPPAFKAMRDAAVGRFRDLGFPTTRHEDWRFTNLSALASTTFVLPEGAAAVSAEDVAAFSVPGLASHRLVFIDGKFAPALSTVGKVADGVRITTLHEAVNTDRATIEKNLGKLADFNAKAFTALNTAFLGDGAFVHVPRGKAVDEPIHILSIATPSAAPAITNPRNLVIVCDNAKLNIIEHYVAQPGTGAYLSNAVTECFIGENSQLAHYLIEEESLEAFQVSSLHARIGRASKFDSHSVLLGGALVRNEVSPTLDGDGCNCLVNGLFVGNGTQHLDNFMSVRHMKPHCESHQFYNGILMDESHGVFSGRIFVDQLAQKTDAKQTSANLLLSDEAQIDTKPQLEIYADDVKCTHGATIGQLDEDALFYLRSRGIGKDAARAMLVFAFAAETFNRMTLEPIRQMLERKMLSRLPEGEFLASVL